MDKQRIIIRYTTNNWERDRTSTQKPGLLILSGFIKKYYIDERRIINHLLFIYEVT